MEPRNDLKLRSFTCGCPVSPAPFVEGSVFPTFSSLASFVIDELTRCMGKCTLLYTSLLTCIMLCLVYLQIEKVYRSWAIDLPCY